MENGRKTKPLLKARIFWDKNDDGEHNESLEPAIPGNEMGQFAFEWISGIYPTHRLKLASILPDQNESSPTILLPLFPSPPSLHSKPLEPEIIW